MFNRYLFHAKITMIEMLSGMLIAFCIAIPLAALMSQSKFFQKTLQPLFIALKTIPHFALAPYLVLIFGWTLMPILIPITLMVLFPLTINLYRGLEAAPIDQLELFRVHGATKWQIFWKLRFPYSLPHLFSGLRVAVAISGGGAIAGEWACGQAGLGVFMQICRQNFDFQGALLSPLLLFGLTMTLYGGIVCFEKLLYALYSSRGFFKHRRLNSSSTGGQMPTTSHSMWGWKRGISKKREFSSPS